MKKLLQTAFWSWCTFIGVFYLFFEDGGGDFTMKVFFFGPVALALCCITAGLCLYEG